MPRTSGVTGELPGRTLLEQITDQRDVLRSDAAATSDDVRAIL